MKTTISCFVAALCFFSVSAQAQTSTYQKGAAYDCTGVELEDIDPETMTKEEKIALLELSLNNSIDKFSKCINKVQTQMAASGGGGGAGSGSGAGAGSEADGSGETSGEEGQGSDNAEGQPPGQEGQQSEGQEVDSENSTSNGYATQTTPQASGAGAKNQIIPPKDNDNIVCMLLWDEISSSTDQSEKAGLIKQYEDMECGE